MPDFPADKPIDGWVGNVGALDAPAAGAVETTETPQPTLRVTITGDRRSDAALLSDALSFVVAQFVHSPKAHKAARPRAAGKRGDIGAAAHGLDLTPADQQKLRRLIVEHVHAHATGADAGEPVRAPTKRKKKAGKRARAPAKRGRARK